MNRRGQGGSKGSSGEWLLKFSPSKCFYASATVASSMPPLHTVPVHRCARTDGVPHLAERAFAEYAPGEPG